MYFLLGFFLGGVAGFFLACVLFMASFPDPRG